MRTPGGAEFDRPMAGAYTQIMTRQAFSTAVKELGARNAGIATAYRDWSRRLSPGPVSRLASSMAEQRVELGKALAELAADRALPETEVEFEIDPASAAGVAAFGNNDAAEVLLKGMTQAESTDYEILATLAGAIIPASSEAAERLASEAAAARKRSIWAQDHLDLLGMC